MIEVYRADGFSCLYMPEGFHFKRPDKCRQIARAGQQRAIREQTWEQRFRTVLDQLGFDVQRQ
ncbi:MAG: glycosyltransferase family 1 protein [Verrucomicrobia bacterium]|nr:glycosyltransferase family 1 protein [Verrucomicrobiota bacterium]